MLTVSKSLKDGITTDTVYYFRPMSIRPVSGPGGELADVQGRSTWARSRNDTGRNRVCTLLRWQRRQTRSAPTVGRANMPPG